MLDVNDLVVRYGGVVALQGVSLHVGDGEAVAVVGPNGAGKTSLLRTISGLVKPARGDVVFADKSIVGQRAFRITRSGVVHVPEGRAILSPLTVRDNLLMGGYRLPKSELPERVDRMIQLFPVLGRRITATSGLLSGGEQQMLAIARGLMANPKLLMIDEPSMGLAPVIVEDVLDALIRVVDDGTAILIAEQNASLALDVSDRAYVLVSGQIVATGASDEVGEELLERYLA